MSKETKIVSDRGSFAFIGKFHNEYQIEVNGLGNCEWRSFDDIDIIIEMVKGISSPLQHFVDKTGSTLFLRVSGEPFEMYINKEKDEEYREIKPYWSKRLIRDFKMVYIVHGYKNNPRGILYELRGVRIGVPDPTMTCGIVPQKDCYVIELGEELLRVNF